MSILDEHKKMFEMDTFAKHLGIELVSIEGHNAKVRMPFDERHKNGMGNAHGGAIFGLADIAFAFASHAYPNKIVSAQSSISYLSSGKVGPLEAEAKPVKLGKRLVVYEVQVKDATENLIAIATITGYVHAK